MIRFVRAALPFVAWTALAPSFAATPAPEDEVSRYARGCKQGIAAPNRRAAMCATAISSGRWSGQDLATLYRSRGIAHFDLKLYDNAIEDFGHAIRLKPDDAQAYYLRAATYHRQGRHNLAILDLDQAIRLKPDTDHYYLNRGAAYVAIGQYDRAIQDYDQAIRLYPNGYRPYLFRCIAFAKNGQYDRAIEDCEQALRLNPDDAETSALLSSLKRKASGSQ
jgi:tetratricopeptide (TPR) repeat protein